VAQKQLATARNDVESARKEAADQVKRASALQAAADQAAMDLAAQKDALAKTQAQVAELKGQVKSLQDQVAEAREPPRPTAPLPTAAPVATPSVAASPAHPRQVFDPEKVPYVTSRENMRRYQAYKGAKALAISTSGVSYWRDTSRQALEACEFLAREPCMLYAVGDLLEPTPDKRPVLGSGQGSFILAQVPFVSDTLRQVLSVYQSAENAKALAVSPDGNYGLAGNAASTEEAQRLALEHCQKAENRNKFGSKTCYVYAVGNTVVLVKRATAPITMQR
jgi:hypothetical protein